MEILSINKVELKIIIEEREYILLLPIGAQLEEAKTAAFHFASALASAVEKNKKEKENSIEEGEITDGTEEPSGSGAS